MLRRSTLKLRTPHILVLGGYGFFGSRLVQLLARTECKLVPTKAKRSGPEGLFDDDEQAEVNPRYANKAFTLMVAGRNFAEAESFCLSYSAAGSFEAIPVEMDLRDLRVEHSLKRMKVDLVINCTGPFYNPTVQWDSAIAARTCAKAGIHYIDIAESAKHHELLEEKMHSLVRESGRNIVGNKATITGASTVPSLSSAAVEVALAELSTHEFMKDASNKEVQIRAGMNPGNNTSTPVGLSAFESVLMRVGMNAPTIENGKPSSTLSWTPDTPVNFPQMGHRPIGIVESPDVPLLSKQNCSISVGKEQEESGAWHLKRYTFGAGVEKFIFQKLLASPTFGKSVLFSVLKQRCVMKLVHGCFNMFRSVLGSKNGGMFVTVVHPERNCGITWELAAFDGDGAYIPCLAAAAGARRLLLPRNELEATDTLPANTEIQSRGYSSCERYTPLGRRMSPTLKEMMFFSHGLEIETVVTKSMYHYILQDKFDALHPALRRFHSLQCPTTMQGEVVAIVPCTLGKVVCWALRLPSQLGDAKSGKPEPFTFELQPGPFESKWIRHYPRQSPMISHMMAISTMQFDQKSQTGVSEKRQLVEKLGPFHIVMDLGFAKGREGPDGQALNMSVSELKLFGKLPLPKALLPLKVTAMETGEGDGSSEDPFALNFFVEASLPVFGTLVQYEGSVAVPA